MAEFDGVEGRDGAIIERKASEITTSIQEIQSFPSDGELSLEKRTACSKLDSMSLLPLLGVKLAER